VSCYQDADVIRAVPPDFTNDKNHSYTYHLFRR